jgi:hypothetical protein
MDEQDFRRKSDAGLEAPKRRLGFFQSGTKTALNVPDL